MTFKEYVEGRVSKENLEREKKTNKSKEISNWRRNDGVYCNTKNPWELPSGVLPNKKRLQPRGPASCERAVDAPLALTTFWENK